MWFITWSEARAARRGLVRLGLVTVDNQSHVAYGMILSLLYVNVFKKKVIRVNKCVALLVISISLSGSAYKVIE